MDEAPSAIDVSFVKSSVDPTGLGEPPFPPMFASLANALYKQTGQRFYEQPFIHQLQKSWIVSREISFSRLADERYFRSAVIGKNRTEGPVSK